jgi:hypothetical protein
MSTKPKDNLTRWETPECYGGADPVGDIIVVTRTRDSSILEESNFEVAQKRIETILKHKVEEVWELKDGSYAYPKFYILRTGHWAVGWIEYLMLRADAPKRAIEEAQEIARKIEGYPVLDEYDYSEREWDAAAETWQNASLHERIEYCAEDGCSIFAARRDEIPGDGYGEMISRLSGELH